MHRSEGEVGQLHSFRGGVGLGTAIVAVGLWDGANSVEVRDGAKCSLVQLHTCGSCVGLGDSIVHSVA